MRQRQMCPKCVTSNAGRRSGSNVAQLPPSSSNVRDSNIPKLAMVTNTIAIPSVRVSGRCSVASPCGTIARRHATKPIAKISVQMSKALRAIEMGVAALYLTVKVKCPAVWCLSCAITLQSTE